MESRYSMFLYTIKELKYTSQNYLMPNGKITMVKLIPDCDEILLFCGGWENCINGMVFIVARATLIYEGWKPLCFY